MLSVGAGTRRFSPSQDIQIKMRFRGNVHYRHTPSTGSQSDLAAAYRQGPRLTPVPADCGELMTKTAPIFQDAAFGPEVTQATAAAFDKACQSVSGALP
jgi:hypothetical protein